MIDKSRRASQQAEKNSQAKLHWADIQEIRASTERQQDIARRFGISQQQVSKIMTGRNWRAAMVAEVKNAGTND
jgi:DNA-binding transcriptional regulator YiaG